jgi:hypothetical protein
VPNDTAPINGQRGSLFGRGVFQILIAELFDRYRSSALGNCRSLGKAWVYALSDVAA